MLTARDPLTGEAVINTRDERDPKQGIKPFPRFSYLKALTELYEEHRVIIVEKSRQMIVSTVSCLFLMWHSLTVDVRRWLISKNIEQDAKKLIQDKIRFPWSHSPEWFQTLYPMSPQPQGEVECYNTQSFIQAVSENAWRTATRGTTASGFLLDEAAFQDNSRDIFAAAGPMAEKIILVSTPSMSLGGRFMFELIRSADGGKEINIDKLVGRYSKKSGLMLD